MPHVALVYRVHERERLKDSAASANVVPTEMGMRRAKRENGKLA